MCTTHKWWIHPTTSYKETNVFEYNKCSGSYITGRHHWSTNRVGTRDYNIICTIFNSIDSSTYYYWFFAVAAVRWKIIIKIVFCMAYRCDDEQEADTSYITSVCCLHMRVDCVIYIHNTAILIWLLLLLIIYGFLRTAYVYPASSIAHTFSMLQYE
jgi:hypothetical protein